MIKSNIQDTDFSVNGRELRIKNAHIFYRNFAGKERAPYNKEGDRNFCVELDEGTARYLMDQGWARIKSQVDPDDDQATSVWYIQVRVRYDNYPPSVYLVTSKKRLLNDHTVMLLDDADIEKADIVIRGSYYDYLGKTGYTPYLTRGYITIVEDEFDMAYADIPTDGYED